MALITKPYTFSAGATAVAANVNSDFDTLYSDYNGNITNANISGSASIASSKLAQITDASKVSGASLTSLSSIPTGAGAVPTKNGGTAADFSATAQGTVMYFSAAGVISALAPGTSGQVLKTQGAAANPLWASALSSILDYGISASTSTAISSGALKIAYGTIDVGSSSSQAITNLGFTSSSTYVVTMILKSGGSPTPSVTNDSGAQFTITNGIASTKTMTWIAIGT